MARCLYLFSSGKLYRKDNSLVFEKEDGKRVHLPVEQTESICVFGELDLNKRVLEFLTRNRIPVHFFNRYDYYSGSFYPREYLNSGFLILEQAKFYSSYEKRVDLAKRIVKGATENMLQITKYYIRRGKDFGSKVDSLENLRATVEECTTIEHIMAIEGNFRELYYKCFDVITENAAFEFSDRSRRPPLNRMNALISFGNSLLYTTCLGECYRTNLDPRIGFLHATNFRSFSLNLDIAEVFKPLIVDRLIFSLVNKGQLKAASFGKHLEGIYLNDKGKEVFVREFDNRLKATVKHPKLKRNVSYRFLIRLELYKLEKHIIGEKEYTPYRG